MGDPPKFDTVKVAPRLLYTIKHGIGFSVIYACGHETEDYLGMGCVMCNELILCHSDDETGH